MKRTIRFVTGTMMPPPQREATEPVLPPKKQMAKNLAKSAISTIKAAVKGDGVKVSNEEAARRLAICNKCEFFRQSDQRCSKCGCHMAYKTYLKAVDCPIGMWGVTPRES